MFLPTREKLEVGWPTGSTPEWPCCPGKTWPDLRHSESFQHFSGNVKESDVFGPPGWAVWLAIIGK